MFESEREKQERQIDRNNHKELYIHLKASAQKHHVNIFVCGQEITSVVVILLNSTYKFDLIIVHLGECLIIWGCLRLYELFDSCSTEKYI